MTLAQDHSSAITFKREFHEEKNSSYWLPKDLEEKERLLRQHSPVKGIFGCNIPSQILSNIKSNLDNGGIIVDLCCGPGPYLLDVAFEFPNSKCIGVDMVDMFEYDNNIKNVTFQQGNLLNGLSFEDNSIDLISLNYGILAFKKEEWIFIINEIKRVLKPGGYFISREPGQLEVGNEFVKQVGSQLLARTISGGQVPYIKDEMKDYLIEAGYKDVESIQKTFYPGRQEKHNIEYFYNLCAVVKSMLPNLAEGLNITPDKYDDFIMDFQKHLNKPENEQGVGMNFGRKPILKSNRSIIQLIRKLKFLLK